MVDQLLREWPPGYGGVERVAHELACVWGGNVYSFDVQSHSGVGKDPLLVGYPRLTLPCIKVDWSLAIAVAISGFVAPLVVHDSLAWSPSLSGCAFSVSHGPSCSSSSLGYGSLALLFKSR